MIVSFERDINDKLRNLETEVISTLEKRFNEGYELEESLVEILEIISRILHDCSKAYLDWHEEDKDLLFSLFPGYLTNSGIRIFNTKSITINNSILSFEDNEIDVTKISLNQDFYQFKRKEDESSEISLLSLAYHYLFEGQLNNSGYFFSPEVGGTHQWISKVADEIAYDESLSPISMLVFFDSKIEARKSQQQNQSWISIPFDLKGGGDLKSNQDEIYDWCDSIVHKLYFPSNKKNFEKIKFRWPFNPRLEEGGSSNIIDYNNDYYYLIFRAYIIAFWLQLILKPDEIFDIKNEKIYSMKTKTRTSTIKAWFGFYEYVIEKWGIGGDKVKFFNFRYNRILELKNILEKSINRDNIVIRKYKYWYTIPFKHRLDFSPKDGKNPTKRKETGSMMIISNINYTQNFFSFIIPWLNDMYNSMREFDTARLITDEIKKKEEEKNKKIIKFKGPEIV